MPGFGRASFSPQSNVRLNFIQIILYFFYKINFLLIFVANKQIYGNS